MRLKILGPEKDAVSGTLSNSLSRHVPDVPGTAEKAAEGYTQTPVDVISNHKPTIENTAIGPIAKAGHRDVNNMATKHALTLVRAWFVFHFRQRLDADSTVNASGPRTQRKQVLLENHVDGCR